MPPGVHHRADHHLQQEQSRERIGETAGEMQLPGERGDIEHQRSEQRIFEPRIEPVQHVQRDDVDEHEQADRREQRASGSAMPIGPCTIRMVSSWPRS